MARTVNRAVHAVRREAFVDAAERLIRARGYEQTSIQDVLDAVDASRGAFYHYFASKEALLEAVVERIADAVMANLSPIAADPELPALEKLQRVFAAANRWKAERRELMLALLRAWFSDDNAIVRERLRRAARARLGPVLTDIVRQGAAEGAFRVTSPDHSAAVLLVILDGSGEAVGRLFVARLAGNVPFEDVACTVAAYAEAVERILGLPHGSFVLVDEPALRFWFG